MPDTLTPTLALLYPGDRAMRHRADPGESRFAALFRAFAAAGVRAEPAIYHDDFAEEVEAQLRRQGGVLVWCNPIEGGRRRDRLDALLRDVARAGVFVSTHPDTIARLGTKDVLVQTRDLPFGSDVFRVGSVAQLRTEVLDRLQRGARVLKQHRGHSGIGVWRAELASVAGADGAAGEGAGGVSGVVGGVVGSAGGPTLVRLRHAQRGSEEETVDLEAFAQRMAPYFEPEQGGHMIDQAWQPRLTEGMVRAYLVEDRVAGFGHQAVNALYPATPGQPAPPAGQRLYHGPDEPRFQPLKHKLESGWIDQLRESVGLGREQLPLLWDCDFIPGEPTPGEPDRHVLCEVNVSSVSPFPPSCIEPLVSAVKVRLNKLVKS